MASDSAEGQGADELSPSLLSLVVDIAFSLRDKYLCQCHDLEEEHLDQAIEQEARELAFPRSQSWIAVFYQREGATNTPSNDVYIVVGKLSTS